jgi:hypothetical protein
MAEADKPLAELAATEKKIDPPKNEFSKPDPVVAAEAETSAAARLKAFEDEHLGVDAVRINGQIERGVGSQFAKMSDAERAQHAALENLVAAEAKLIDAHTALMKADADCEAAAAAVETAEEKANAAAD